MKRKSNDSLGDRMKTYENVTRTYLTRRTPVVMRLDGCHFHTFTRGFDKPYDAVLCRCGGIGRHTGLKILRRKLRASSSLVGGTNVIAITI